MAEPKKQPKIVSYGSALYAKMSDEAKEAEGILVWQGRLIATCLSLGIPEGYYKKVVDALTTMRCMEVVNRGRRGGNLTMIVLHHPPTQELYDQTIVDKGWDGLTSGPTLDTVAARLEDVIQQIGGLNIPTAFKEVMDRIEALEEKVNEQETALQALQTNSNTN